ncbi:MAG: SDR family NAD(P)-dependent oxidoreductase, partial [Spirochaetota bacterium]|nr:SDR family NAD(P)-dependent oxidoreductase [Spirochaetota bacterium]
MTHDDQLTAVVTGASGAIGEAIARQLATNHNYNLILVGRDSQKLQLAVKDIIKHTNNQNVGMKVVDLSRQS